MKNIYLNLLVVLTLGFGSMLTAETVSDSKLSLASALETEGQRLQGIQDSVGIEFANIEFYKNFNQMTNTLKEAFYQQARFTPKSEITEILDKMKNSTSVDEKTISLLNNHSLTPQEKLYELSLGSFVRGSKENFEAIKQRAEQIGYEKAFQELAASFRSRTPQADSPIYSWCGNTIGEYYFLIFSGFGNSEGYNYNLYYSDYGRLINYDVKFVNAGIGLGFIMYYNGSPAISYDGEGPIDGTYYGIHLSLGASLLGGTLGIFLNSHGRLILFGGGGGLGAGIGFTEITIATRQPGPPEPDLNDPKYKITPVPIYRD